MEYVRLGATGLEVSQLCLGTWKFGTETNGVIETDRDAAHEILDAAWEQGINFFDTANSYGDGLSEEYLGDWLAQRDREDFVVASKVYWATRGRRTSGLSRKIIRAEIEDTLERLGTDYLDIYYIHSWHEETPIQETLSTLNELVRDGTVHYLGASNLAAWQLLKSLWVSDTHDYEPFSVVQPRFNAINRESIAPLLAACADQQLAVCGYSPLAGGFLTGKYSQHDAPPADSRAALDDRFGEFTRREWGILEAVRDVATETDATCAQVALQWAIETPDIVSVPIVGARSVSQLEENLGALDVALTPEQYDRIANAVD